MSKDLLQLQSFLKRVPWTDLEDNLILEEAKKNGHINFASLHENNRLLFHPTRSVRSIEAHFYRMKKGGAFEGIPNVHTSTKGKLEESEDMEDAESEVSNPDGAPPAKKKYKKERSGISKEEKKKQKLARKLEKELLKKQKEKNRGASEVAAAVTTTTYPPDVKLFEPLPLATGPSIVPYNRSNAFIPPLHSMTKSGFHSRVRNRDEGDEDEEEEDEEDVDEEGEEEEEEEDAAEEEVEEDELGGNVNVGKVDRENAAKKLGAQLQGTAALDSKHEERSSSPEPISVMSWGKPIAYLKGTRCVLPVIKDVTVIGRKSKDLDISAEGESSKVSRKQSVLSIDPEKRCFLVKNTGKREIVLGGKKLKTSESLAIRQNTMLEICGLKFLFEIVQTEFNEICQKLQQAQVPSAFSANIK